VAEMGDQLDPAAKEEIDQAIAEVKGVLNSESTEEIKAKTDALQAAFHKVSEQIYQAAAAEQGAGSGDGAGTSTDGAGEPEEEVVDAEVVDDERS
jgi:molecular chaperone DnaK